jgi:hypothetical protein
MRGFFLNSSRILKDFRKKYAMQCILCKIIFARIFLYARQIVCNLFALLCWKKISSCQKVGVTLKNEEILKNP